LPRFDVLVQAKQIRRIKSSLELGEALVFCGAVRAVGDILPSAPDRKKCPLLGGDANDFCNIGLASLPNGREGPPIP
jgi:hypothetical protein